MEGFDYSKIEEHKIYDILRPLGKFVNRTQYKIEYIGTENIPAEGGFILASNHMCALDPLFIAIGMKKRQLHFMGKKELFENKMIRWFLSTVNGFPIVRGGADSEAMNYAIRIVKEGKILGIFPEGTRSKDHKPAKAKSGVAVIAKEAHSDILPVSIYSSDDMKKHTKLTIRFGNIIRFEELGLNDDSTRTELKDAAAFVMDKIIELWEMGHRE